MAKMLGPEAKVRINATALAAVSGSYTDGADAPDATDTESYPYKEVKDGGLVQLEANLEVHIDNAVNHWQAPLSLITGEYIDLEIFPYGLAADPIGSEQFLVERVEGSFRMGGSEIQVLRFSGRSNGSFDRPVAIT